MKKRIIFTFTAVIKYAINSILIYVTPGFGKKWKKNGKNPLFRGIFFGEWG